MWRWAFTIPLIFLVLKPVETFLQRDAFSDVIPRVRKQLDIPEPKAREKVESQGHFAGKLGLGIIRRLDDASFWTAILPRRALKGSCLGAISPASVGGSGMRRLMHWHLSTLNSISAMFSHA